MFPSANSGLPNTKSLNNPKSRRGSREMGIAFIDAEIVWNADFQRLAILSEAKRKGPPGDRREIAYQFVAVAQLLRIGRDAMILQITRRRAGNHFSIAEMSGNKC